MQRAARARHSLAATRALDEDALAMDETSPDISGTRRRRAYDAALALGVLLTLAYCWMFSGISAPNERSRVYLGVAIVDQGTLSIDGPIKRFGRINDWARHDGRAYTDKAPGSSFLYAVVYGIARVFTDPGDWSITQLINLARTWLMLPLGLLGFLVMRRVLYEELGLGRELADAAAVTWMLGTNVAHYAHAFYGHQIVAVALLCALWGLLRAARAQGRSSWVAAGAAGAAAGLAGFTEYQAGAACALLAVFALATLARANPRALAAFALGAAPFVVALGAYNDAAFGGPFELSYHHLVIKRLATLHNEGVGGVGLPRAELVAPVLVSLHRGLFTSAPITLLWLPGCLLAWRGGRRRLAALCAAVGLFYVLIVMGTRAWFGGWSFGPRLITPALPFMIIPAALTMRALSATLAGGMLWRGLAVAGVLVNALVRAVLFELPDSTTNPLVDAVAPALRAGTPSPNLAMHLGVGSLWGLLPFALLTLGACLWLLLPKDDEPRGAPQGAALAFGSMSALTWLLASALLVGPTWSAKQSKKFDRMMARWTTKELKLHGIEPPPRRDTRR
jgi:hypothetical protein